MQTQVYCALSPSLESESGRYYSDCCRARPHPRAEEEDVQKRLQFFKKKMPDLERTGVVLRYIFRLWEVSSKSVGLSSSE